MAAKKENEKKYVVYLRKLGRVERGILLASVTISGEEAFVHRNSNQADILSAANVFDTKEAAENYLAGTGVRRWMVSLLGDRNEKIPVMVEVLVEYYTYTGRYHPEYRQMAVKRLEDGKNLMIYNEYQTSFYKTKKEAETAYAALWRSKYKETVTDIEKLQGFLKTLDANKPRSKKKA